MLKHISKGLMVASLVLVSTAVASAHVVVRPSEVGLASFQTFTTSVPNEKEVNVVAVRLVVPDGLNYVSPTVKPGWNIETKKTGSGEDARVTEISWTGGNIPVGQRDDFTFSAQAPSSKGEIQWKAYQSYSDGTIVAWDQEPKSDSHDGEEVTPYSTTKVVDDLAADGSTTDAADTTARVLGGVGVLVGLGGLLLAGRRK